MIALSPNPGAGRPRASGAGRVADRQVKTAVATAALILCASLSVAPLSAQSDAAVQRLMLQAESLAASGEVDEAIAEYRRVAEAVPDSPLAADALLAAARLYDADGRGVQASRLAEQVLDAYPTSTTAAAAAVLRARILAEGADGPQALEAIAADLEALLLRFGRERYPALTARAEALTLIGALRLRLGETAMAAAPLVEVLEDEVQSEQTARADLLFGESLLLRGQVVEAVAPLQRASQSRDPEDAAIARAHLTLIHRLHLRPQQGMPPWSGARALVGPSGGFKRPRSVAASGTGDVAVIDNGIGAVLFDDRGITTAAALQDASRPFFEGGEIVYVTPGAIELAGVRGGFTTGGAKPKELNRIEAATRDGYGRWIVVERSLDGLGRFDRERGWLGEERLAGEVVDVTRDRWGRVYALSHKPSQVRVYSGAFESLRNVTVSANRPSALDVDSLGNLYILDDQQKQITVVAADGTVRARLGPVLPGGIELRSPQDFAVDGAGRVYIVDGRDDAVYLVE
mgnify:FL=1